MTQDIVDKHFIRLAWSTALSLSKDPHTTVGAIVSSKDYRQVSFGFNGLPKGVEETKELWDKELKHHYVCHAEINAVMNCPFDTKNTEIFVTHKPCHRCMSYLINAQVTRIVYNEDYINKQDMSVWTHLSERFEEIKRIPDDEFLIEIKKNKDTYRLSNFFK